MEFRQLQYFVAVAEELHFTRAARRLHITQPPISLQIQKLEEKLQVRLFERTKRSVKLTPAGKVLLREARPILERINLAQARCRRADEKETGELAIGFIPIAIDMLIVKLIRGCNKQYPGVRLSLHEMGTNDQLKALRCGGIQVGFVQAYEHDLLGLESRRMVSEPYQLAVPENHALARRRRIPIRALEGINVILPPRHVQPRVYEAVVSSCRLAGFEPLLDYSVYGKHAALALVAEGLGVTPITRSYLREPVAGVVGRPIEGGWPRMEIRLAWAAGVMDPVLEGFIELAAGSGEGES